MHAYLFPGQASQFPGMGADLYRSEKKAAELFDRADEILGFNLSKLMFEGSEEDLKQTRVTQPAVFLYSYVKAMLLGDQFRPDGVAGHSLGEFTALTAAGALTFEQGLRLVKARAEAMQQACEKVEGTMAAVVGLDESEIEDVCAGIDEIVIPANYNCPGQLVISGTVNGVHQAIKVLESRGARKCIPLAVGGAFHSPLMEPAEKQLASKIEEIAFDKPRCPVYQNATALPSEDPDEIQKNLIRQLTSPVRWTQTMRQMMADGYTDFTEVGARVLSGFLRRLDRKIPVTNV